MNYWICWVHAQRCRGAAPQAVVSHVCGIWSANCMEPGPACGLAVCAGSLQAQQSMQSSSNLKHCTPQNKTRKRKKWKRKKKYNLLLYKYKNFFPRRFCPDDQRVWQGSRWCISVLEMAGIFEVFIEFNVSFFLITAAILGGSNNTSADVWTSRCQCSSVHSSSLLMEFQLFSLIPAVQLSYLTIVF